MSILYISILYILILLREASFTKVGFTACLSPELRRELRPNLEAEPQPKAKATAAAGAGESRRRAALAVPGRGANSRRPKSLGARSRWTQRAPKK